MRFVLPAPSSELERGIRYQAARTLDDVIAAWTGVYDAYMRAGLIRPNSHLLHTVPHAIHPDTAVVIGFQGDRPVATVSAYSDGSAGVPLADVYVDEVEEMRREGRRVVEVGLLARDSSVVVPSFRTTLDLMKHAFFYGRYRGATDLLIGVHPHHVRFYERMFGFHPFAGESTCPFVNYAPVVGLRLEYERSVRRSPLPPGLGQFLRSPAPRTAYAGRLQLTLQTVEGSRIEWFLEGSEPPCVTAASRLDRPSNGPLVAAVGSLFGQPAHWV